LKEQHEQFAIMPDKNSKKNNFTIVTPQIKPDSTI